MIKEFLYDDIIPEYENETVATEVMECLRKKSQSSSYGHDQYGVDWLC